MATGLMTSGKIAEATGKSPAAVKKAIAELGIEPTEKKGPCCYYDAAAVKKITAKLK